MLKKSILVLCIDRDNDLFEKVKISGPIVGREANLSAATRLALADPEETDANAMFKAINIFDEMSKEHRVEIVTLTGSKNLGYEADKEISEQLEHVLATFPTESCIFVSDGMSDEEIVPIIKSRVKIDSVKLVVMKQAKELEKTYFVLLEKLRDPYYSRMIFGIPALVLLLFSLSSFLNFGWQPVGIVLGIYLILKGFGIEERIASLFSGFEFNVEKISLVVYLSALPLLMISLWIGGQAYMQARSSGLDSVLAAAYFLRSLLVLLPWALLLLIVGKVIDLVSEKRKIEMPKYGLYAISIVLFWLVFSVASDWVLNLAPPYVTFSDFLVVILLSILIAYLSTKIMRGIKIDVALDLKLEGKEVLTEVGAYAGKIIGVDRKNTTMIIQSQFGQKFTLPLDAIISVSDKVQVRSQ
ncbi:MAG TPA: DUF373 family protein [Candidatus Micrarchaeota archaeon]|nr:DUF373 family protein [Candidatus Micrarchaeota archaeon]